MKKIVLASAAAVAFVALQGCAQTYSTDKRAPRDERAPTIDLNSASLTNGVLLAGRRGSDEPRDERAPKIDLNSA